MKTQRRPFMVEVKRGTTRSAFTVKDRVPEIFRKAEAVLFRPAQDPSPSRQSQQSRPITGRVLPSIIEDQPTPNDLAPTSYDPPKRRGRPLGSKNKAKVAVIAERPSDTLPKALESFLDSFGAPAELRKKRGRPPGSRNKPKTDYVRHAVPKKVRLAIREAGVKLDDHDIRPITTRLQTQSLSHTPSTSPTLKWASAPSTQKQGRLRDRSKILSRYVYGTKPLVGSGGLKRRRSSSPG